MITNIRVVYGKTTIRYDVGEKYDICGDERVVAKILPGIVDRGGDASTMYAMYDKSGGTIAEIIGCPVIVTYGRGEGAPEGRD